MFSAETVIPIEKKPARGVMDVEMVNRIFGTRPSNFFLI